MWSIIIFLIVGIIVGNKLKLTDRGKAINGNFQLAGLLLLLFSMGISIGANSDVIANLSTIGIKAFLFAVLTTLGSIVLVYVASLRLGKEVQ